MTMVFDHIDDDDDDAGDDGLILHACVKIITKNNFNRHKHCICFVHILGFLSKHIQ